MIALAWPTVADEVTPWAFYGQINFGLMSVDNGGSREIYFAENPQVPGRVGVFWKQGIENGALVSFHAETGLGFTDLSEVSPSDNDFEVNFDRTELRKFELIYTSDRFGQVSLGQGSMASDGASGVDLSGTGLAHGPAVADLGGATEFLFQDGTGSDVFVSDVFDDLDGPRRFRLRYDTPDWNGLGVAVAYGQEVLQSGNDLNYRDIGLIYASETQRIIFEAAASYEWIDSAEERVLASASLLDKSTGLTAALATGANRKGDGRYAYTKLGFVRNVISAGTTAVSIERYAGDDLGLRGSHSDAIGIGAVQSLDALNLDLFLTVRRYDLDTPANNFQHIHVATMGARWSF